MGAARIYIGRLNYDVRERDLEKFFKGYGKIREILIKNGFGFVEFEDHRDADDAVYDLNGKELLGDRVTIEHARGSPRGMDVYRDRDRDRDRRGYRAPPPSRYGPPTRTEYRLIVENLSSRVSWQDLKDYMRQAGEVTYADAHKDRRNEGVVEFASYSDMKNAIRKLDDTDLSGRRIKLVRQRQRRSRSRSSRSSRSRSRSRSRSASRSRSRSKSRSKSRSRSKRDRSRSKSRSRSATKKSKRSRSRSKSRNDSKKKHRSRSRSKSRSGSKKKHRSRSHSKSRSRSASKKKQASRSRSRSADNKRGSRSPNTTKKQSSHSRSKTRTPSRSRSRSKSKSVSRSRSRSASPVHRDDEISNTAEDKAD